MTQMTPTLSIRDLSERTAVPQATLRSWEARYGFPSPERLAGGHRRYTERDVAAVQEVLRQRQAGLGLEAAIRRVESSRPTVATSVYAELRRLHPDQSPQLLSKRSMVALSHAIEDEYCARARRPVLVASFQRQRFYLASYARWVELARTAALALVFADFGTPKPVTRRLLVEVAVPYDAPLNREWLVICDAPDHAAMLVGWERPPQEEDVEGRRRFEVLWSVDPEVVRDATRVCLALATSYRPDWRPTEMPELEQPPRSSDQLRRATELVTRSFGYLDTSR